jgi:Protein NO VEIN, C-terminal
LEKLGGWPELGITPEVEGMSSRSEADSIDTLPGPAQQLAPHEQPPSVLTQARPQVAASTAQLAQQAIDYEERDHRNRELGRQGEEWVLQYECEGLRREGRPDLADRVDPVAVTVGDSAGFDIRSFDPATGKELHIEVKTTTGPATIPFYMSAAERDYAASCTACYLLYRLYHFDPERSRPDIDVIEREQLQAEFEFTPASFRVRLRS